MKQPSEGKSFSGRAARWVAVLMALAMTALPPAALANISEDGDSSINSMVGKNDLTTSDPIVTGSGSVDYALPLLDLGGPMGLSVSLMYNRAMKNWWSETRNYFPTHGDKNFFWLPPMSAAIDVGASGHDVILPGGEKVSFIKDGDKWILNETDMVGYRQNSMPIRYAAATSGESANRFWVMDPSRDLLLVYDYTGVYWSEGKLLYAMDRNGNKLSFSYDGDRIHEITDGLGRTLSFAFDLFDGKRYLHQIIDQTDDENPRSVTFAYDTNAADMDNKHALRSVTDVLGQTRTFRWSVVTDSGNRKQYDNLVRVENPRGADYFHFDNVWDYVTYKNAENEPMSGIKVTRQTDAEGNATEFSYDPDPYVTRTTYPDTTTGAYAHDNAHVPPSQFTDATDEDVVLTKNAHNQVTSMIDRTGGTTQITYHEPTGKLLTVTNADNKVLSYTYTPQVQTFADPDTPANTVDFTFYNLTKIDYPDGTSETFVYDNNQIDPSLVKGNMTAHTDRTGKTWTYTYNARGQVLTATNPAGGVTTYTYNNADATLATSTDSDTGQTAYAYDTYKRLIQITRPGGATVQIAYNLNNRVTSMTDERGKKYDYAYDTNGNLARVTDPDTRQTLFSHDFMDRVDETTNARGKKSQYAYDNMNRLQSVTDPNGNTVQYGYNSRGWLDKVTDGGGHEWTTGFDNEGLPTSTTTPMNRTTTITRDALGYISNIKNPLNQETVFTRDEMSRITKVKDPLNRETSYDYDDAGNLIGVTLPLVGATTYRRNGLGLVDRITDLKGSQWNLGYTGMGRFSTLTDPLTNEWQYDYDTRGRLDQVTYPGGATQTRTYDDAGNLLQSLYSAGPDLNFTYDDQDRLLTAENIAFSYNEIGQVTATTNPGTAFGATYDNGGRLETATYNNNQFSVTYTYDARDLLTKVTDSLTGATVDFSYDNDGRLTTVTRSSTVGTTFTWDAASRVTRIQHGALADLQYTYNAAGEVTRLDYDLPLDPADYLATATDNLSYDAASQITTAGYAYDALGRQTAAPSDTFTWDGASRLTATTDATMTYNGLNDLRTRQNSGATIRYYYNYALGLHPVVAEYNETASAWKRFYVLTPGGTLLYAIDPANANAVAFYHFDKGGNTLFLTDAHGSVTDRYAYSPYGRLLAHNGPSDQPFTFVGAWQVRREGDAGLYQMRARYYDARTARFLSREPLWPMPEAPLTLNQYQYARNNPISFIDMAGNFFVVARIDDLDTGSSEGLSLLSESEQTALALSIIPTILEERSENEAKDAFRGWWAKVGLDDLLNILAQMDPEVAKKFLKALGKPGDAEIILAQKAAAKEIPKPNPKANEFHAKPAQVQTVNLHHFLQTNQMKTHLGDKEAIGKLEATWFYGGPKEKDPQPRNRYDVNDWKKRQKANPIRANWRRGNAPGVMMLITRYAFSVIF